MALFSIALILSALAAVALKAGNLSACFSLGAMAALVLYLCVISWKSERLDKDRIKLKQDNGEKARKKWLFKRRAVRVVALIALVILVSVGGTVGLHNAVRMSLHEKAVNRYQAALEQQETANRKYQEELQQYYIDARLAMGLDENGWLLVSVDTSRKAVYRSGPIGWQVRLDSYINGTLVEEGKEIEVQVYADNEIESQLTEIDSSVNDVGTKISNIFLTPQQLSNGKVFSHEVTVSENRGRYAGNYLTMQVTYIIKAVNPLNLKALENLEKPHPPAETDLKEPSIHDIPDNYLYTATHNTLGQIVLILLIAALCWYTVKSQKKDEKVLAGLLRDIEWEAEAEARRREQERQLLIKEQEEEVARQKEQERLRMLREKEEEDRLDAIADAAYAYAQRKEWLKNVLEKHTPEEMAGVPRKVKFTDDLIPYDEGFPGKYGHYSVYIAPHGKCYHAVRMCCGAWEEVHLFDAISKKYRRPCMICAKRYPYAIPEWYEEYKKLKAEMNIYNL